MKKIMIAAVALSCALPVASNAQQMTEAQLIELARENNTCGERFPVAARYTDDNRVAVTCSDDAEGFVPVAATGLGLGGAGAAAAAAGLGLAALAAGGGGSTPDTQ